jgi:hypothetical protein
MQQQSALFCDKKRNARNQRATSVKTSVLIYAKSMAARPRPAT